MPRLMLAALAAALLTASGAAGAAAQQSEGPLERVGRVNATEYIRGLLANDRYDPRDRERALNGAQQFDPHWRSSIFDGRRTRATRGTGLRLPDLPQSDAD